MYGVIQRPTSGSVYTRQRGDKTEVHWQIRPPAQTRRGRSRKTRRNVGLCDAVEALAVIAILTLVTVCLYAHSGQGGLGL